MHQIGQQVMQQVEVHFQQASKWNFWMDARNNGDATYHRVYTGATSTAADLNYRHHIQNNLAAASAKNIDL